MSNNLICIGLKLFPNLLSLSNILFNNNSIYKPKTINFQREFKNTGYIRKIHSISKNNNHNNLDSFHISSSSFYRGEERNHITCRHNDFLLISDYYTSKDMTFFNKLILIQCDFSSPKNYNIICTKEAPFNRAPLRVLESEMAFEISKSDYISII